MSFLDTLFCTIDSDEELQLTFLLLLYSIIVKEKKITPRTFLFRKRVYFIMIVRSLFIFLIEYR